MTLVVLVVVAAVAAMLFGLYTEVNKLNDRASIARSMKQIADNHYIPSSSEDEVILYISDDEISDFSDQELAAITEELKEVSSRLLKEVEARRFRNAVRNH